MVLEGFACFKYGFNNYCNFFLHVLNFSLNLKFINQNMSLVLNMNVKITIQFSGPPGQGHEEWFSEKHGSCSLWC